MLFLHYDEHRMVDSSSMDASPEQSARIPFTSLVNFLRSRDLWSGESFENIVVAALRTELFDEKTCLEKPISTGVSVNNSAQ